MALGVPLECPFPWEDFLLSVMSAVWLTDSAEALWLQTLQHVDDFSITTQGKEISLHRDPQKEEITGTSCNLKKTGVVKCMGEGSEIFVTKHLSLEGPCMCGFI